MEKLITRYMAYARHTGERITVDSSAAITKYLIDEGIVSGNCKISLVFVVKDNLVSLEHIIVDGQPLVLCHTLDVAYKFDYDHPEIIATGNYEHCHSFDDVDVHPYY